MKKLTFLIVLTIVLTGCGPKLTPIHAVHELEQSATLDQADSAKVGESLLCGLDMFAYTAYSPRQAGPIPAPHSVALESLEPEQQWIAYYRLDDGSVVIEAPKSLSPEAVRLGLRIDTDGRVVGKRPWFDLKEKSRISQPSWDGERRYLFVQSGSYAVDTFVFDLKYKGMRGENGVFEYADYKASAAKAPAYQERVIAPKSSVQLHGLDIRIVGIYSDHVRYVVEPVKRELQP